MDRKSYDRAYEKMIKRIIVASSLLLAVFFFKQFAIQYQIDQEINTSYTINLSGRQRMLSQKIVKDIAFIYTNQFNLNDEKYKKDLEASLKLWKESHEELLDLNKEKKFLEKENSLISQKLKDIEPSFYNMVGGVEGFLREIEKGKGKNKKLDFHVNKVIENESVFFRTDGLNCLPL